MPQVPTVDAPTVGQSGAPIGVNAPATAFGASVLGEGLSKIASTEQEGSDMLAKHAEQFQAINNKAESDGAYVSHLQQINQFAADYQSNNRGIKAMNNLPDAFATIEKQRTAISGTLSNPTAQAMFDADSRRATANVTGELTRFATAQRKEYLLKQATASQEALASDSVIHNDQFDANMAQMMERQAFINDQLGLSPEEGALEARKLYGNTVGMISETMAGNGNVEGGHAFLEAHKDGMDGKVYAQTLLKMKPALMANDAATIGHNAVTDALHGMGSDVGPTVDYLKNVHGREGDAKNPHSTAEGVGQFTTGTWANMMKKPEFAEDIKGKSPAEIQALRHDPSVANRAILAYGQDNATYLHSKGLPVNAATVGLAHGYGPGGAESLMRADVNTKVDDVIGHQVAVNNRVSGQTVGQVTGAFVSRFGTGASVDSSAGGAPTSIDLMSRRQAVLDLVDQQVTAKYGDNAVVRDQAEARALSELGRQVDAARGTEGAAFTTLGTVAQDSQIQDLPTLLKTVPNGLQMYNTLPLSQRTSLQAAIHHNAVEITAPREQLIDKLNGMYGMRAQSTAFLDADIANMDLPLSYRIDFLKKQAELRGKPAAADPQAKQLASITRMPEYKSLVGTGGLNLAPGSDEEFTLQGAIAGQLSNWATQHPTQPPAQKDIQAMLARAASQHSYHYDYLGGLIHGKSQTEQSVPVIAEDDKAGVIKQLNKLQIPVTPYTIAKYYSQHAPEMQGTK